MRRRAYRALLALFPRRFRREHGRDMERLFEDMRTDWIRERGGAGAPFWASLVWDSLRHALGERLRPLRHALSAGAGDLLGSILGDVRYALRQAVHHPLYSGTIVLLLAVGVGGNAMVFRLVNGLFLRPLPFEAAERLVDLDTAAPEWNLEETGVAYPDFLAWREGNRSFEAMAVVTEGSRNLADRLPQPQRRVEITREVDSRRAHGAIMTGGPWPPLYAVALARMRRAPRDEPFHLLSDQRSRRAPCLDPRAAATGRR
ncbi:MAG: hypothetical protein KY453_07080 [Gemmatimonadetes bacterium]|nr:hypothetical protein [Gemmatimonadota bacterium]